MPDTRIPFTTLPNWLKAAARCGIDGQAVVQRLALDPADLHPERARVSPADLDALMDYCVQHSSGPHFPFVLGETFAFEYLSDLETFVTTSGTLREAARVFVWLQQVVHPMLDLQLRENGAEARLVLGQPGRAPIKRYYAESVFASVLKCGRGLMGADDGLLAAEFSHADPGPQGPDYAASLQLPVHFGCDANALVIRSALLDQPLPGHLPALHDQAESRIRAQLNADDRRSTRRTVERSLRQQPALLAHGPGALAEHLKLHPRTLQRRLQAEGAQLHQLLEEARAHHAQEVLQTGTVSLDDLAEQLGFSDRRSFTRAFKRWTGETPSAWRRRTR